MCRHIGYIGKKKDLNSILLKHKHSLIELAYKPKHMKEAKLNADGFGLAWKNEKKFQLYKNYIPIWNDLNLSSICKSISSSLVIGNVRSATIIENQGYFNTHPFYYKNYIFSHNGYIKEFNSITKDRIYKKLNIKFKNLVKGNTDSELIFILLMQYINNTKNIEESIRDVIEIIKTNFSACMLNFLLATINEKGKDTLFATKFAKGLKAPSLFYIKNKNHNITVSSEKLNEQNWITIKNNSLLRIHNSKIIIKSI